MVIRDAWKRTPAAVIVGSIVAATGALGQAPPLDVLAAMRLAREQAPEAMAARSRASAAESKAQEARAVRWPELRAQEIWTRTDSPADAFGLTLNQERFSFAQFVAGDPNDPRAVEAGISRLEMEVPIWTGGEIGVRIRQARLSAAAARETAARAGDTAALGAAQAWIQLAQAREFVRLIGRARETVAAHVELARAYSAQGMLVRSELLRAEVELARVEDLLAEASGRAKVAAANLAFRLGQEQDMAFEPAILAQPPSIQGDLADWLARAEGRGDLKAARLMLEAGDLEARARQAQRLPRVGLVARHDWVDDAPFGTHGDSFTVMAAATWSLFDGGRRKSAVVAARSEAEAARLDVGRFAEGVRLEVRNAYEEATVAAQRRATAAQALDAASEGVRIVEERFRAGVMKTLDVLDVVTARREAETRELVARAEANLAAMRLAVAAGQSPESVVQPETERVGEGGKS
jgi:outer membrane protein TolC